MNDLFLKFKDIINPDGDKASLDDIIKFENFHNVLMSDDLKNYFRMLNGSNGEYDENFFAFNSLDSFKSINEEFSNWKGVPNYSNLITKIENPQTCFVIADYQMHLFSYAIRLYNTSKENNEIYALCGDKYKIIASSFTQFVELYLSQSINLWF